MSIEQSLDRIAAALEILAQHVEEGGDKVWADQPAPVVTTVKTRKRREKAARAANPVLDNPGATPADLKPSPPHEVSEPREPAPEASPQEMIAALTELGQQKGRDAIAALFALMGVKQAGDIPKSDYGRIVLEVRKLLQ
jgi:hypothetical protein